jgi:FkbM family methyltransferase
MKRTALRIINSLGWDLRRIRPPANSTQLLVALEYVQANVVFDIGANTGQFAQKLRAVGYHGKIVSFDPLSHAHDLLTEAASRDPAWIVHPRTAVGDQDGEVNVNIAGNSVSSSILPMLDAHYEAAAGSAYVASERTPLVRLDSVAERYLSSDSRSFIKIDTQGFEWQVLDGAPETLQRAHGVLLEMSLVSLYEGQRLWRDLIERMETTGFTLWAIQTGFVDPRNGRTLQVDGIFLRS